MQVANAALWDTNFSSHFIPYAVNCHFRLTYRRGNLWMVKSENVSLFGGLSHLGPQPVINQSSASDAFNECSNNSSQEHQLEASHERSQQKNNPKKSGSFLNKLPKHQFFLVAPKTRCQAPKRFLLQLSLTASSRSIFKHLNGCPHVWNPLKKIKKSPNLLGSVSSFLKKKVHSCSNLLK